MPNYRQSEAAAALKVIFICPVSPFPKNVGKTLVTGGICEFFQSVSPGVQLKVLSFEPVPPEFGIDAEVLQKPSLIRKILNILLFSIVRSEKSIQESIFWSAAAKAAISNAIDKLRPDIVIYDTVRTGQYLKQGEQSKFRRVLYLDDLFSVRYGRLLAADEDFKAGSSDALGNFSANLPRTFVKIYAYSGWLRRWLLKTELRLVAKSEDESPSRFDICLLISDVEAQVLKARTRRQNIVAIPPRIDRPQSGRPRTWDGREVFVFLGSLNLSHNAFGIEYFLAHHLAGVKKKIPNVRILVVGRGASEKLKQLAEANAGHVQLMGFVEDLDKVLLNCCAMLSPLLFGSGIKVKAIDALRCGVPLITTTIGIEGVDVADVPGVFIEDRLDRFADRMVYLLQDGANRVASVANSQAFQSKYSGPVVDRQYFRTFLQYRQENSQTSFHDQTTNLFR